MSERNFGALLAAAALCLSGCASKLDQSLPEPVLCMNNAQCTAMWSRAQLYVAQKSRYPMVTVTESVIQTAPGRRSDPYLSFTITREIMSDGSGVIRFMAGCNNIFSCVPSTGEAGRQFFEYISAAR